MSKNAGGNAVLESPETTTTGRQVHSLLERFKDAEWVKEMLELFPEPRRDAIRGYIKAVTGTTQIEPERLFIHQKNVHETVAKLVDERKDHLLPMPTPRYLFIRAGEGRKDGFDDLLGSWSIWFHDATYTSHYSLVPDTNYLSPGGGVSVFFHDGLPKGLVVFASSVGWSSDTDRVLGTPQFALSPAKTLTVYPPWSVRWTVTQPNKMTLFCFNCTNGCFAEGVDLWFI